ncbi:hypothetical protein [Corynebacterium liangguodongii]|uniref:Uncharacterized protein n=1 Tax=Corynebacterium liangguodongii TaxID=2079535 RepID=A0A2S0WDS3_9CORY|nr:hypothetical protein [Corynebacterium liangguodongii]AWB83911.1 hypothetical protein C3E79_04970 [Corynebacterium liangguodongii]PWB99050.1 hypothetical protein DF219_08620 [Corynebacterium liangguodongii]
MRKRFIAAVTAATLLAPATAGAQEEKSSVEGFGTDAYVNLSSESDGARDARETVQSSTWMGKALASSDNDTPVLDAWVAGSSLPDTLHPVDMASREINASSKLFSGDVEMSAQGSSQLTTSWIIVGLATIIFGQLAELVMRGIRTLR